METCAFDFAPWGLAAEWPVRRWLEPIYGRRDEPVRGVRLGHASSTAMVLTCSYPRSRFDAEVLAASTDPLRELAFETTYAQINLALHQIRAPGARPDGLIGSLVRYASQEADRYRDWPTVTWDDQEAVSTRLASWESGFSLAYPDVYVIVHACGVGLDGLSLRPADELEGYDLGEDPLAIGAMHWELWSSRPDLGYDDLTKTLGRDLAENRRHGSGRAGQARQHRVGSGGR
jgi:hypothetical protein